MKLGIVMDPAISGINIKKDSSFAMLLAAKSRGWQLFYIEPGDLFLINDTLFSGMRELDVFDDPQRWFVLDDKETHNITVLDFILMRKDPPFNMEYIYVSYLLEYAERKGVPVFNKPQGLRDINEKFFITHFSQCITATQVCQTAAQIKSFIAIHQDIIIKTLDAMGGDTVFRIKDKDKNLNVIIDTVTAKQTRYVMVQAYIPAITEGDKRVLLIDGLPIAYALARIPSDDDFRGNLAKGARAQGVALSDRDRWICEQVGPTLKEKGVIFAGLDIIGNYLTEINVTSPTCIRELDKIYDLDIAGQLMDTIAARLPSLPSLAST